ncbi:ATP-binding protein [Luteococcus peritonei]|uniref:AAA family ATPase n=1 Tax=Luteococcus peritonei TaxID=88874 RepID=A0ABW4RRY5_9ACTN
MDETTRETLDQLHALLRLVQDHQPGTVDGERLADRLAGHLGMPADQVAVLTEDVPAHRFLDADIALEMMAERDPQAELIGVGSGDMKYHTALSDLLQNNWGGQVTVAQPDLTVLPDSPTSERSCLGFGIRLFRHDGQPVAVLVREANPRRGQDSASLEVMCPDRQLARDLLAELKQLAIQHSVLRGQVIAIKQSGYEQTARGITFLPRPEVAEQDVVLPAGTLERIKQHVLGIAAHADELRRQGQHLKRGVLLYGPPGTGKTHTVRHLVGQATDHTVVLMSGTSLQYVGQAAQIARALQPAIVVLEDVDLVAESRDLSYGAQPLLFEVMDAMDGLDGDADVTFLLTTNRVEAMEEALTQRPGRVDLAAEISLPDLAGRQALLRLYAPAGAFTDALLDQTAGRLESTTASLAKELVRRAVLRATLEAVPAEDRHLREATEALLADSEELSRVLLGARSGGLNPVGLVASTGTLET